MTDFLASVNTIEEAIMVEQLGVDIIDLKNPNEGALGAIAPEKIKTIVSTLNQNTVVSATIGDLPFSPETLVPAIHTVAATGVNYIKIGLFNGDDFKHCFDKLKPEIKHSNLALIGVLFADQTFDLQTIEALAECGFKGVMLDTANKSSGTLTSLYSDNAITRFVNKANRHQLFCGLAGSLRVDDINQLIDHGPDYLGFRGALCHSGNRVANINVNNIIEIRNKINVTNQNVSTSQTINHAI